MSESLKVLIVGGGIAGASCALALARLGVEVDLVEKSTFPRNKVCGGCIGPAGMEMLDRLGLRSQAVESASSIDRWLGSFDSRSVELPIPSGIAISREVLDPMILNAAREAGANIKMQCSAEVRLSEGDAVSVDLTTRTETSGGTYDVVVIATGLAAGWVEKLLPWQQAPHGPFGVACRVHVSADLIRPGTIYMACDDDGYVGIVRLPCGRADVAAALRSGSKARQLGSPLIRIGQIIQRSSFELPELDPIDGLLTTPMLRRRRMAGSGRVIAIGDSAGYVEPFTGEGMTWAMQSAVAAAERIANCQDPSTLGHDWQRELDQLLRHKKRICRIVTDACRSQFLRSSAAVMLGNFPSLANPLLKTINRV